MREIPDTLTVLGSAFVVAAFAACVDAGTYWQLATNTYDYPAEPALCFAIDGIDWRAEQHCPMPEAAHEAAMRVAALAALPDEWTVVMLDAGDVDGAAGMTVPHDRRSFVADAFDPMEIAAHELMHAALWQEAGDTDNQHADPRWGLL